MSDVNYKSHKSNIFSSAWVVDIKKWFKRWYVEYIIDLSSDHAMKYGVIEEILMDLLRRKKKDAKRTKLEITLQT